MKCEHGIEIVVEVVSASNSYWDDGIETCNEYGNPDTNDTFLLVNCPECRTVKAEFII